MKRTAAVAWVAGLILLAGVLAIAASSAIEGRWKWTTETPDSGPTEWTAIFKVQDGKLTGTAEGEPGQFEFKNLKMNGAILTGGIEVEGDTYTFEVKLTGNTLEGTWKLDSMSGSIKGVRESSE
ncbi:MAG: hypothetical protein LAP39_28475 [Acidobacteriia bacterium]|nr:hypothetical protein [Terriglobia bacterium]